MSRGREYHSWNHPENSDREDSQGNVQGSLKNPPSMHLRDDMAKRRVKTSQGYKVMECALQWSEFEKKYGLC